MTARLRAGRQALWRTPLLRGTNEPAQPPVEQSTGGGDEGGIERHAIAWREGSTRRMHKLNPALEEGVLVGKMKKVYRMLGEAGRALGVAEEKQLLELERYLLVLGGKRECLYAMAVYRKLFEKKLATNIFLYKTGIRSLSLNHYHLTLSKPQLSSIFTSLCNSMSTAFCNSPTPYLGSVLPLYVKACVGLGLPDALKAARDGLTVLEFPLEKCVNTVLADSLEDFAREMYLLARLWDRQSCKNQGLTVITKTGKKKVIKRWISQYHYDVVTALQVNIFDTMEARTASFIPHLHTQPEVHIGSVDSFEMCPSTPTVTVVAEAPPQYRKLFKRRVRMPKLD